MEDSSLQPVNVDNSTLTNNTTNNLQSIENTNWYDGSMNTFIHQNQNDSFSDIREIPNDQGLREIDLNAVGDEFFLFSPRNTTDDEPLNSINNNHNHNNHDDDDDDNEIIENPSKRIFTMEENILTEPFDFHANHSSLMITNLDDILINDNEENNDIHDSSNLLNAHYHRPIQEDILYEVEHENSLSDHSHNTSAIIPTDHNVNLYSYLIINK